MGEIEQSCALLLCVAVLVWFVFYLKSACPTRKDGRDSIVGVLVVGRR